MSAKTLADLVKEYEAMLEEDTEFEYKAHVFPRYLAPVIVEEEQRIIKPMFFGLVPFFEKNEKPKMVFHNARIETIDEKVSFKKAYSINRCLVPLESFFEYVDGDNGKKKLLNFSNPHSKFLTGAGIYNEWVSPKNEKRMTFSLVTTSPPSVIENAGHDRCPMFLDNIDQSRWLRGDDLKNDISEINQKIEKMEFRIQ